MVYNKTDFLERVVRSELVKTILDLRKESTLKKEAQIAEVATDFFESNYQKLTNKLEEILTGDQMQRLVTEKLLPSLQEPVEEFIEKNKDKKEDYLKNPSLLMEDIEKEFPLIKMLRYLDDAFMAVFVASTAFTLWTSLFGPLGLATGALTEAGKYFAKRAIKDFLKKEGKEVLKKIVANITLKKLKTLAASGALALPKTLLAEATRQASFLIVVDVFLSVIKDLGFEVVRLAIIKEGSKQFGIPQEVIAKVAKADSEGALTRILTNAKEKVLEDLTNLFSTMEGFKRLALGAALNKFYSLAFPGKKSAFLATNAKLHLYDLAQSKDFKETLEKKTKEISTIKEQILTPEMISSKEKLEDSLARALERAKLPSFLLASYKPIITENEENLKDEKRGEEEIKHLVQNSKFIEEEIKNNYREIALIEFINKNFGRLEKDEAVLQPLLDDALDQKRANLEILMDQSESDSASEFFKQAIQEKKTLLQILLKRLAKSDENLDKLGEKIKEGLDLESYKSNLEKEVFGY